MKRIPVLAALLLAFAGPAFAADSFQFAPPPFPILNLRAVDAQSAGGFTAVSQEVGDFTFGAGVFGGARTVKKWENGGVSLGGNFQLIGGSGDFDAGTGSKTSLSLFGFGFGFQPNLYFDLAGHDEDDFSLPIYFGPHFNGSFMSGSLTYDTVYYCGAPTYYCPTTGTAFISVSNFFYGWQAGIQAGINLGDSLKFVPYVDFSQDLGGSVSTSVTASGSSTSTTQSVSSQPMATSPGFDLVFRKIGLSLGGASQALSNAGGSGKSKTLIFTMRWTKKFKSICGI